MPPATRVPGVVLPSMTVVFATLDASAACCPAAPAKVHYLLAYRRDTLVIENRPSGPAVPPPHA